MNSKFFGIEFDVSNIEILLFPHLSIVFVNNYKCKIVEGHRCTLDKFQAILQTLWIDFLIGAITAFMKELNLFRVQGESPRGIFPAIRGQEGVHLVRNNPKWKIRFWRVPLMKATPRTSSTRIQTRQKWLSYSTGLRWR